MRRIIASFVLAALGIGCGVELGDGEPETEPISKILCPPWVCGDQNSPNIAGTYFHELNMTSTWANQIPGPDGVALVDFVQDSPQGPEHFALHVIHGRIIGTNRFHTIGGSELVGAVIVVLAGGTEFHVKIDEVNSTIRYWAKLPFMPVGQKPPLLEAYRLTYQRLNDTHHPFVDLCTNPPDEYGFDVLSMLGATHDVLVFEGERIEADHRIDVADPTGQWFSIGCAGGALAKMYLTGHTIVAGLDGFATTQPERQTILKMFSADYCGDGTPFTVSGQPLLWADNHGWMKFEYSKLSTAPTFEARWNSGGAVCLSVPRASIPNTPAYDQFAPNVAAQIISACSIPACNDTTLPYQAEGFHLFTVNP